MHVLLVGAELEENLALRYLAAALERAGHSTAVAPLDDREDTEATLDVLAAEAPDVVGLSMAFQRRAHEFGALATAMRTTGCAPDGASTRSSLVSMVTGSASSTGVPAHRALPSMPAKVR